MAMMSMELNRKGTGQLCCDAQRHCLERQSEGYEVNCCAVATCCDLPHRSGTEKHRQARQRKGVDGLSNGKA
nr:MAG TPA: hypothetical protein [Caudoviricetes sp.]